MDNNVIAVVESRKLKRQIKRATRHNKNFTELGNIENGTKSDVKKRRFWAINRDILEKANEALDWALDKGKVVEKTVTMNEDKGNKYIEKENRDGPIVNWELIYANGPSVKPADISIHNHPTGSAINTRGNAVSGNASEPSGEGHDDNFFKNFKMNIIVGLSGYATTGYVPKGRTGDLTPVVIDSRDQEGIINVWGNDINSKIGSLTGDKAKKILNYKKP